MSYTSPKTGAKVNPGKRKKLPKSKVSKKTQKSNRKKIAKTITKVISGEAAVRAGIKVAKHVKHAHKTKTQDSRNRAQIRKRNAVKKAQKKKRTAKDKV